MEAIGDLLNKKILITRQNHLSHELGQKITNLNGRCEYLPLFDIEVLFKNIVIIKNFCAKINKCDFAICISHNAAAIVLSFIPTPRLIQWATVGPKTADFLRQHGATQIIHPMSKPYDSKALIKVLKLTNKSLENKYIMVLTGENDSSVLQDELTNFGAIVETFFLYKRVTPKVSAGELKRLFNPVTGVDIVTITCVTSLNNLISLSKSANIRVQDIPLLVVSNRIYEYAVAYGFTNIYVTKSMSDADILDGLLNMVAAKV